MGRAGLIVAGLACTVTAITESGLGVLTPAIVSAVLRTTPQAPEVASGASNTARQTGGALGVAAFGTATGNSAAPGFLTHSTGLLVGAAFAFGITAALRLTVTQRTEIHRNSPLTPEGRCRPT